MARRRLSQPSERFDPKALRRDLDLDQRKAHVAKIRDLRIEYRQAKQKRDDATRAAVRKCREEHTEKLMRAQQLSRDARLLAKTSRQLRDELKQRRCSIEGAAVRREEQAKVDLTKAELAEERRYKRDLDQRRRSSSSRFREGRSTSAVRRSESDGAVESNIAAEDPGLVSLWRSLRRSIKGSPRQSREEQFYEYVEAHPEEALAARGETSDDDFARMQREDLAPPF